MEILGRKVKISSLFQGDKTLWMLMLVLCIVSVLVIYSSTASMAYRKLDGNTTYYLSRQIMMVLLGIGVAVGVQFLNYKIYYNYARFLFYASLIVLSMTFFVGAEYNEESRWLKIYGLTFQPSDLTKITLVMILAKELAIRQYIISKIPILPPLTYGRFVKNREKNINILIKVTLPLIFPVAITAMMIMVSNLSTALIVGFTAFIVLLIGRVRLKELWRLVCLALVVFVLFIVTLKVLNVGRVDTWVSRIENFVSDEEVNTSSLKDMPADQFQKHQARVAVASGWLGGVGPGNSTQRSTLPHPYSDYAYAFIVEEYGLLGALAVLVSYLAIFYRALVIFRKCRTAFPALLVLGLSLTTTIQAMLHMAVSVDAGPVTGQTLPLISWGGSSLIFTCMSLGIIQGIARRVDEEQEEDEMGKKRHLVLEEWSQVELDDEVMNGYDDESAVLLTSEESGNDKYSEDLVGVKSVQEIDLLLQKDRLSKALSEDKYQSVVIWQDKKNEKNEDNI